MPFDVPGYIVLPKRLVQPWLNAQSPSERWDGHCALSHGKPFASGTWLSRARKRPYRTVAATAPCRLFCVV